MIEFYSVLFGCSWLIGKAKACRKQKAGVYLIHACFERLFSDSHGHTPLHKNITWHAPGNIKQAVRPMTAPFTAWQTGYWGAGRPTVFALSKKEPHGVPFFTRIIT